MTAWAADGLVMGVRHREYPVEGIQFHPESILTDDGAQMLSHLAGLGAGPRTSACLTVSRRIDIGLGGRAARCSRR